jgi:hypothetical protein
MKLDFHLKLAIGILAVFGLLFIGMASRCKLAGVQIPE